MVRTPDSPYLRTIPSSDLSGRDDDLVGCVIVAGSVAIDLSCEYAPQGSSAAQTQPQLHTSNPSSMRQTLGGVGQNVASALHHLDTKMILCSSVGTDLAGEEILSLLKKRGISTDFIQKRRDIATAQYVAVNDVRKNLVVAMADMTIMETRPQGWDKAWQDYFSNYKPRWLVVDTNWDAITFHEWLRNGNASGARVAVEPVSVAKSRRIFDRPPAGKTPIGVVPDNAISLATPNALELRAMHEAASSSGFLEREDWFEVIDSFGLPSSGSTPKLVSMTNKSLVDQGVPQQCIQLLPFIPCILTTLGEEGVLMTMLLRPGDDRLSSGDSAPYIISRSTSKTPSVGGIYMRLFPPTQIVAKESIASVNGAGDTFLGVIIAGLARENPKELPELIEIAQKASVLSLKSSEAINPAIKTLKDAL